MSRFSTVRALFAAALLAGTLSTTAAANNTGTGALIGGLGGLAVGAATGDPLKGAIVGTAGGAVTGAIIDSNQKKHSCYINKHHHKVCRH